MQVVLCTMMHGRLLPTRTCWAQPRGRRCCTTIFGASPWLGKNLCCVPALRLIFLFSPKSHKSYRPVTTASYRVNHSFFGLEPYSYAVGFDMCTVLICILNRRFHVVNVLLHGLVCGLFAVVCSRLFPGSLPQALAPAAIFAAHAIHTEAVRRTAVLSCIKYAVLFFVEGGKKIRGGGALLCFVSPP